MRRLWITLPVGIAALVVVVAVSALASPGVTPVQADDSSKFRARLLGFEEVPAVSTVARGQFEARISRDEQSISFTLSYSGLEAPTTAAHIHLGQHRVNGGVSAFLCGGSTKPACPPSGTVTGTITADDVIGPSGQGIAAGEFAELLRAMRAGVTYANVHSTKFPSGEVRGQIQGSHGNDDHD